MGHPALSASSSASRSQPSHGSWRPAADDAHDDLVHQVGAAFNAEPGSVAARIDALRHANAAHDSDGIDAAIDSIVETLSPKKTATSRPPQQEHHSSGKKAPDPARHHAHPSGQAQPGSGSPHHGAQSIIASPAPAGAGALEADDEAKLDLLKQALQDQQPPVSVSVIERLLDALLARLTENRQVEGDTAPVGSAAAKVGAAGGHRGGSSPRQLNDGHGSSGSSSYTGQGGAPMQSVKTAGPAAYAGPAAPAAVGPVPPSGPYAVGSPGNPANWYSEPNPALLAKIQGVSDPALKAKMLEAANQPGADWLTKNVSGEQVRSYGDRALAAGKLPFYVTYARDNLDQDGGKKMYSAKAASGSQSDFLNKIREWGTAIGSRNAVIALEPDALMQSSRASPAERARIQDELVQAGKLLRTLCPNATILLPVGAGAWGKPADVAAQIAPMMKAEVNGVPVFNGITVGEAGSTPNIGRDWGHPIVEALASQGVPGMKVLEDSSRNGVNATSGNGADPSNYANNTRRAAGLKAGAGTEPWSLGNVDIKSAELSDGRTSPAGTLDFPEWTSLIRNAMTAGVPGW